MGSFVLQSSCFLEILASGNKSFSFGGKTELYHSFYLEAEGWDETLRKLSAAAKSLQSWPTLCNPIDSSPPGSPVPGVLQARTLDWVAISFSNTWKWKVKVKSLSHVRLLAARGLQPTRLLHPWDFPGKSTFDVWLICLFKFQVIYPEFLSSRTVET